MKNKFLFGKIYTNLDDKEYGELIDERTRYEIMFNEYLNEIYDNDDSKLTIWNKYLANVLSFEKSFNKYVYEFSMEELKEMLRSIPSDSLNTQDAIYGIVKQYLNYQLAFKRNITINILSSVSKDKILKVNKKALKRKVIGLKDFWNKITEMETKTDINNLVAFVFARFGIIGVDMEHILNAKLDNIDRENLLYHAIDSKGNSIIVPIDERFINFCEKVAYEDNEKYKGIGDIIKRDTDVEVAHFILYNRQKKAVEETGIKMVQKDLYNSRILDFVLEIRKERRLVTSDFQKIILMFYPDSSAGRYFSIVKFYENLTNDKVLSARKFGTQEIEDKNGVEFVERVKEELNFY